MSENRLKNPFNPPETLSGGDFTAPDNVFQVTHQWATHLVGEQVADGGGASTDDDTIDLTETEGLYMVTAVDSDATTFDADGGSGPADDFNFAWCIIYFAANMTTPAAFICATSDDAVAVQSLTTDAGLNFAVTSGVLQVCNQMGSAVDIYCTRIV